VSHASTWVEEIAAFALVATASSAVLLGWGHAELVLPFTALALVQLVAAILAPRSPRLPLPPRAYLTLVVPYFLLAQFNRVEGTGAFANLWFYGALACLVAATGRLWAPRERQRLPHVLALSGVALAVSGSEVAWPLYGKPPADVLRPAREFQAIVAVWALGALAIVRSSLAGVGRPGARLLAAQAAVVLALVVGIAVATRFATDSFLRTYDSVAPDIVNRFTRPAPAGGGFSGQGKLGSIEAMKQDSGSEVALQAFGKDAPGYLRGKVFVDYEKSEWNAPKSGVQVAPERADESAATGLLVLPGRARPPAREADLSCFPSSTYSGHFFLPLDATAFATASPGLGIFAGGACWTDNDSTGYDVFRDLRAPVLAGGDDAGWKRLPQDPAILAALDRAIARLQLREPTCREAWRAIQSDFARRYTYKVGIRFDPARDPVVQFLDEADHGHCELFASAGALMLRRMGFAARYVTGFLCQEKGGDGLWLARQKHAHAWIEVFEPEGWRTVELTPASGVPGAEDSSATSWEATKARLQRAWALLKRVGVAGALRLVARWILAAWYRWGVLLVLIFFAAWKRWGRRVRPVAARRVELPPELAREREKLLALERRLARAGWPRDASETLGEFAARLEASDHEDRAAAVAFLRSYASRRYAARP
jgi:transglutaminase-like putative cysteine protease